MYDALDISLPEMFATLISSLHELFAALICSCTNCFAILKIREFLVARRIDILQYHRREGCTDITIHPIVIEKADITLGEVERGMIST